MKRNFLLFLIFIASSQIVNAQISKGDIFLGGSIGYGSNKTDSDISGGDLKRTNFVFAPALGFVIKKNLVLGFDIPVSRYTENSEDFTLADREYLQAGMGVFLRKYFGVATNFYLFTQGRLGWNYLREETTVGTNAIESKGYAIDFSFYPGVSYAVKKNIHLEAGFYNLINIGYHRTKGPNFKTSSFYANAVASSQTTFSVGVRFFLPGKNS